MTNLRETLKNNSMNEPDRLCVSMVEAARMLGLSERKVFSLTKSGELKCKRVGTRVLYPIKALQRWLEED